MKLTQETIQAQFNRRDGVVAIHIGFSRCKWAVMQELQSSVYFEVCSETGRVVEGNCCADITSEHTPPRTQQEIVEDLASTIKVYLPVLIDVHEDNLVRDNVSDSITALLKEAKQVFNLGE